MKFVHWRGRWSLSLAIDFFKESGKNRVGREILWWIASHTHRDWGCRSNLQPRFVPLIRNRTCNSLVLRPMHQSLSHPARGNDVRILMSFLIYLSDTNVEMNNTGL